MCVVCLASCVLCRVSVVCVCVRACDIKSCCAVMMGCLMDCVACGMWCTADVCGVHFVSKQGEQNTVPKLRVGFTWWEFERECRGRGANVWSHVKLILLLSLLLTGGGHLFKVLFESIRFMMD